MRKGVILVLFLLAAALGGCTKFWGGVGQRYGILRVVVNSPQAGSSFTSVKNIPEVATNVRLRVWHPQTRFNSVTTVDLLRDGQTVDIPIPAGDNYTVDVLSYEYDTYPLALTGGRATGVDVAADAVTNVAISLQAWDVDVSGPNEVAPEAEYTLTFFPSNGGGLLTTDTFDTATLRVSENDFSDPATPLPAIAGTVAHAKEDRIDLTAEAPDVVDETAMYALALVQFTQDWFDYALPDPAERSMFLELPNRHMGEALHELTVRPAVGGIVIVISGEK